MHQPTHEISIDFVARGRAGRVAVSFASNDDPGALGCGPAAQGFPVCQASVSHDAEGYEAFLGWVQLVGVAASGTSERRFDLDPLRIHDGLDTPFCFYGIRPILFDAPSRRDRAQHVDWLAHSFLCVSPTDDPMDRHVAPVVGFSWGFVLHHGSITQVAPRALEPQHWAQHIPLLSTIFPSWTFLEPE